MAVGVKVGSIIDEIGTSEFFYAFFSTISYHLEKKGWGSKYPHLMDEFYQGKIEPDRAFQLIKELKDIQKKLRKYKPKKVIWDIDDLSKNPPLGNNISPDIDSLSNYFVTSTGKDIFDVLFEALEASIHENKLAEIVKY